MGLVKSKGNMYDWVTHMHTHLGGECSHKCSYCYVGRSRFGRPVKYTGPSRLIESELSVHYGTGRVIFIEHMNDLFADGIKDEWIARILGHCRQYDDNEFIFQTKNTVRAVCFAEQFPTRYQIGTTIETNRDNKISSAPAPLYRSHGLLLFSEKGARTFVTVEPILDFDVDGLVSLIWNTSPSFVNIGADSKKCGLAEPSGDKILALIERLRMEGITIRRKINLARILDAPK